MFSFGSINQILIGPTSTLFAPAKLLTVSFLLVKFYRLAYCNISSCAINDNGCFFCRSAMQVNLWCSQISENRLQGEQFLGGNQ